MAGEMLGHESFGYVEFDKFPRKSYENIYDTKNDWTAWDLTEVSNEDWKEIEGKVDVITGGFPCFAAGTLITTSEGLKPIEEVKTGDMVLTHTNQFKPVVVPMKKEKRGIYELKVQGIPKTLVTEEHPYYVREMTRVWDNENRAYKRVWSEPKWVEVQDLEPTKHFVGFSENKNMKNPFEITEEEAWLLGRYIADGYIQNGKRAGRKNSYNNKVVYCVGKEKLEAFKENVSSYNLGVSEERTVYKVRVINKRFMDLALLCGRGSENKHIPSFLLDLPHHLLELVLDGYMSGDGYESNGKYKATSVSKNLVFTIGQAVQKVYQVPYSIVFTKRPETKVIEGRTVNQRDTWSIEFKKQIEKQTHATYIDGMLWMPVKTKDYLSEWEGEVYNFEVAGDNSYVANNATVHNCQAFSVAGKGLGFSDTRGTVFFHLARAVEHVKPKVILLENVKNLISHDKGKTIDTIIKTLNDIGYTIDYTILNSKHYDVPQNRERVFIVGIRDGEQEEWDIDGTNALAKSKKRIKAYPWSKTFNFEFPENDVVSKQLLDVLEPESDIPENLYISKEKSEKLIQAILERDEKLGRTTALRALGLLDMKGTDMIRRVYDPNGISPTLTTMAGGHQEPKILVAGNINPSNRGMNGQVYFAEDGLSPTVNTNKGEGTKIAYCPILTPDKLSVRQNGRRLKNNGEEMFTLTAQDRHGIIMYEMKDKVRVRKHEVDTDALVTLLREHKALTKLNNKEIAESLDKPRTLVEHWFRTDKSFAIPEAEIWFELKKLLKIETEVFDAPVTEFIEKDNEYEKKNRVYDSQGIAPTLTRTGADEKILHNLVVRKLTPRECWRLQAFPDWAYDKAAEVNSASQLYKQAGNSITVSVAYEIMKRLPL